MGNKKGNTSFITLVLHIMYHQLERDNPKLNSVMSGWNPSITFIAISVCKFHIKKIVLSLSFFLFWFYLIEYMWEREEIVDKN